MKILIALAVFFVATYGLAIPSAQEMPPETERPGAGPDQSIQTSSTSVPVHPETGNPPPSGAQVLPVSTEDLGAGPGPVGETSAKPALSSTAGSENPPPSGAQVLPVSTEDLGAGPGPVEKTTAKPGPIQTQPPEPPVPEGPEPPSGAQIHPPVKEEGAGLP